MQLEHSTCKLLKESEKWKKSQTNMLWTYGLGCCVNWQITPNTIYDVIICTCTLPLKLLLMHFWRILKYFVSMKLVAVVAYSFRGLVLKSLVVEMHKHVYRRQKNNLDVKPQECCEKFLKNLKGVVFYSVPHAGGT